MRDCGFTLVELVTTLVIVGLLTAIAAPRFFDQQPFAARGYADEIANAMRLGQRVAIGTECPVRVIIDATGSYSLVQQAKDPNPLNNTCLAGGAWTAPVINIEGSPVAGTAPNNVVVSPALSFDFATNGRVALPPASLSIDTFAIDVDADGKVTVSP